MKFIATCVMLAGLIGCTTTDKEHTLSDNTAMLQSKSANPVDDDYVPEAVAKLLAPERVDQSNYRAQAKLLAQQLEQERKQLEKTESARRD